MDDTCSKRSGAPRVAGPTSRRNPGASVGVTLIDEALTNGSQPTLRPSSSTTTRLARSRS
jgi:hypothetical protein